MQVRMILIFGLVYNPRTSTKGYHTESEIASAGKIVKLVKPTLEAAEQLASRMTGQDSPKQTIVSPMPSLLVELSIVTKI